MIYDKVRVLFFKASNSTQNQNVSPVMNDSKRYNWGDGLVFLNVFNIFNEFCNFVISLISDSTISLMLL